VRARPYEVEKKEVVIMGLISGKRCYDPNDSEYGGSGAWWSVRCKSDPRFNMSGEALGTWDAMAKCDDAIKKKIAELGLTPDKVPSDIEYSGGKP
jgi:hypothetical protein